MLSINISDIINMLTTVRLHLAAIGMVIFLAAVICIAVRRLKRPGRKLARSVTLIAMIMAVTVFVNLICTGPASTALDLLTGRGTIRAATADEAIKLAEEIGEEGIVLLENDDDLLPLAPGAKLNVFGWASVSPIQNGALHDACETVDILQSLKDAGIGLNEELTGFYTDYKADRPKTGGSEQDWTLPEPNVSLYGEDLINRARAFSDTAMIVIARSGAAGADLPMDMTALSDGTTYRTGIYDDELNEGNDWNDGDHYLQLSNREAEMVDLVCRSFANVILVYNGANPFELGFVRDYDQIRSVLWTGGQGHAGMKALGGIITGRVNPSGRTVDTFVYEMKSAPWWNNTGDFRYTDMTAPSEGNALKQADAATGFSDQEEGAEMVDFVAVGSSVKDSHVSFVNYTEGIYVGYKFYETAAEEGFIDYEEVVQYPFGYGLSYTSFDRKMGKVTENGGKIRFDVTVTNTGSRAGKDVVEVYFNPPYTNGGIEKASANLIRFRKTSLLEPGASETVTISFDEEEMAGYDEGGSGGYVLEEGDYILSLNSDSHTILDRQTCHVGATVIYQGENRRKSDLSAAVNLFDYAAGDLEYLSRADGFANFETALAPPVSFEMAAGQKEIFYGNSGYLTAEEAAGDEDPGVSAITTGVDKGIRLMELRGLAREDPVWDAFMDQLTLDDMNALISRGGYQTAGVETIGKIRTNDGGSPDCVTNSFTRVDSVCFPSAVVLAAAWNEELSCRFGGYIGRMADEMDVSGWYAPAMNIHRTAFGGRNCEYYSEDGILSGSIAAGAVKGVQKNGVYAYMKHFALNEQETDRRGVLCTWTNEQAMREIYLKPFERCVKDAGCLAVIASPNCIGGRRAGCTRELLKTVLRDEWGFTGFVAADCFGGYGSVNVDQAIRNGSDLMLADDPAPAGNVRFLDSNGSHQAMRECAENILYVVVNSRAYADENQDPAMAVWKLILLEADIAIGILLLLSLLYTIRMFRIRTGKARHGFP